MSRILLSTNRFRRFERFIDHDREGSDTGFIRLVVNNIKIDISSHLYAQLLKSSDSSFLQIVLDGLNGLVGFQPVECYRDIFHARLVMKFSKHPNINI